MRIGFERRVVVDFLLLISYVCSLNRLFVDFYGILIMHYYVLHVITLLHYYIITFTMFARVE